MDIDLHQMQWCTFMAVTISWQVLSILVHETPSPHLHCDLAGRLQVSPGSLFVHGTANACCCSVGRCRPLLFVCCFCQGPLNNPAHVTLSARRVPAPKVHLCMQTKALQAHDRRRKTQASDLDQVASSVEPNSCWKDNSIM
jgi:hypothetical protein